MRHLYFYLTFLIVVTACDDDRSASGSLRKSQERQDWVGFSQSSDSRPYFLRQFTQLVRDPKGVSGAELWDQIASREGSRDERRALELQLIEGLVSDGRFEEAKDLILSSTGPGERRQGLVFSLFTKYNGPLEAALKLAEENFSTREDQQSALSGISRSLGRPGGIERIQEYLRAGHQPVELQSVFIAQGLATSLDLFNSSTGYYDDPDTPPAVSEGELPAKFERTTKLLHQLLDAAPDSAADIVGAYIRMTSNISPALAWQGLMELLPHLEGDQRQITTEVTIRNLVEESPSQALDLIRQDGDERQIGSALERWLNIDSHDAYAWFRSNSAALPQSHRDAMTSSLAQHDAKAGNLSIAWEWVGKIDDPDLKQKAEGQVWATQRDAVRQQAARDPAGTVQAIVSGDSQHGAYWIEEAMMTWISKEPDKAESWYQKNWNSLPPAKAQYIAAAYAKEALGAGDLATARQWTNLIKDPKTKERIAASIDKAQSTQGQ